MEVDKSLLMEDGQLDELTTTLLESSKQCPEDLLDAEPHPSDQTLAMFADLVYSKKTSREESDSEYVTRILSGKLSSLQPSGWKLLVTANNTGWFNGFFGAAFYHTGLQQVVVAHRGTDPKCFGAVYTDITGIFGTNYTSCMNSAVTFVDSIRQVIHLANNQHNRHYTLTITGHSLGAWLAQITAFSVKYLCIKLIESKSRLQKNSEAGIHAKTVGFDSPGARDMLARVLNDYYYRYEMNAPSLDGLDITLYLSAPNHINTCGVHVGRIYRVHSDVSNFTWIDETLTYSVKSHAMNNFIDAFKNVNCTFGEVLDWAKSIKEYKKLFKILNFDNNYHGHATDNNPDDLKKFLRYKVAENRDIFESPFRVFSEVELQMLFRMQILLEQKSELTVLKNFIEKNKLKVENAKLLPKFDLNHYNRTITCESGDSLVELCKRLKQLMRWLKPQFTKAVEEQIKVFNRAADIIYYSEGQSYLDSLSKCLLNFEDSVGFRDFLVSRDERVSCLVTTNKDVAFQMSRLRNILYQMERSNDSPNSSIKYIRQNHYTFVNQSQLQNFVKIFGWPVEKKFLMVVDCTLSSHKSILQLLKDAYEKDFKSLKLVLIVSQPIDTPNFSKFGKTVNFNSDVHFSDLTPDSQNIMFNRGDVIITTDKAYSFREFLGDECSFHEICQILSSESLKNFATIQDYAINIKDTRPTLSDIQMPFFKLNIKTSMEFFRSSVKTPDTNNLVVMSGLSRDELETETDWDYLKGIDIILTEGDAQLSFRDTCNQNQDKCIYLFEVLGRDVYCKEVFNRRFYLDRQFLHRAYIDVKKFAETEHAGDLFVINSEPNKKLLVKLIENCRKKEAFTNNILVAPTEEDMNVIQKYINKRIHFVKICQNEESYKLEWRYSHDSVESLLPFMSTDSCEPINEIDLRKTVRNLTIITDEPGMGKTTTLSSLSRLMDSPWVIYIGLRYFQGHIGEKLSQPLTRKIVANFLLGECSSQAGGLLEYLLESKLNTKRVVLMLDGFDELDDYVKDKDKESAKQNIIKLLIFLKNIPTVQIFLTARKYLKTSLEKELGNLCTSFVPFNKEEQLNFLFVIWRSCISLELGDYGEEKEGRLKEFAGEVLRQAKEILGPDTECIMGIPLQLRMLAEVFRPTSDLLLHSPEILLKQINIESTSNLYKKFISLKYEIYFNDKTSLGTVADEHLIETITENITTTHSKLGFKTFFPHFYDKNFDAIEDRWLNILNRVGLVQTKEDGDFQFVHRTYAEYWCAEMVVYWLNQRTLHCRYELFKDIIIPQILLHPDSKIIRMFMNVLLNETTMSDTALELNAKFICQLWNEDSSIFRNQEHQTVLHIAVLENNVYIATLLLRGLKIESAQEAFVSLIQQYDQDNNTAINYLNKPTLHHICESKLVYSMTTNILQHIGACSDENKANIFFTILFNRNVSKSDKTNDFDEFYASDESDETAEKFFFERFFNRHDIKASQVYRKEETINIIKLFYRDISKNVICKSRIFDRVKEVELVIKPFIEAVKNNNVNQVQNILFEKLKNNVERYCLVLMKHKDQYMGTVLHLAIRAGHLDIVRILVEQTAVPFTVLMAQRDWYKKTPLHAADKGQLDIMKYLVERGADINTRGASGKSVLMYAALGGELLTVKYLVERGADIHATDAYDWTILHHAAWKGPLPVVKYFLKQGVDPDRVAREGWTALTRASWHKNWDVVRLLLKRGVDVNADEGKALSYAIRGGEWSIVEALINKGAAIKESQIERNLFEFKVKYPNYEFKIE